MTKKRRAVRTGKKVGIIATRVAAKGVKKAVRLTEGAAKRVVKISLDHKQQLKEEVKREVKRGVKEILRASLKEARRVAKQVLLQERKGNKTNKRSGKRKRK